MYDRGPHPKVVAALTYAYNFCLMRNRSEIVTSLQLVESEFKVTRVTRIAIQALTWKAPC